MIKVQREDFNADDLLNKVKSPPSGCVVCFIGTVRDHSKGREISRMSIEVYEEMAVKQLEMIREETIEKFGVNDIIIVHRYGDLNVEDNIVFIGVAAGHRPEGFDACRHVIEELKVRVPLWKKEYTTDGEVWVEGDRHE
ncbi:MAG: molybdenum cofactor biosynthesis protein MoaE [Candidatus Bathyarchaeota archaeon]|nr:molybdenum cofactor biosynthesis protein MoaE [Candidatus Bathyarchaeota archaeon]